MATKTALFTDRSHRYSSSGSSNGSAGVGDNNTNEVVAATRLEMLSARRNQRAADRKALFIHGETALFADRNTAHSQDQKPLAGYFSARSGSGSSDGNSENLSTGIRSRNVPTSTLRGAYNIIVARETIPPARITEITKETTVHTSDRFAGDTMAQDGRSGYRAGLETTPSNELSSHKGYPEGSPTPASRGKKWSEKGAAGLGWMQRQTAVAQVENKENTPAEMPQTSDGLIRDTQFNTRSQRLDQRRSVSDGNTFHIPQKASFLPRRRDAATKSNFFRSSGRDSAESSPEEEPLVDEHVGQRSGTEKPQLQTMAQQPPRILEAQLEEDFTGTSIEMSSPILKTNNRQYPPALPSHDLANGYTRLSPPQQEIKPPTSRLQLNLRPRVELISKPASAVDRLEPPSLRERSNESGIPKITSSGITTRLATTSPLRTVSAARRRSLIRRLAQANPRSQDEVAENTATYTVSEGKTPKDEPQDVLRSLTRILGPSADEKNTMANKSENPPYDEPPRGRDIRERPRDTDHQSKKTSTSTVTEVARVQPNDKQPETNDRSSLTAAAVPVPVPSPSHEAMKDAGPQTQIAPATTTSEIILSDPVKRPTDHSPLIKPSPTPSEERDTFPTKQPKLSQSPPSKEPPPQSPPSNSSNNSMSPAPATEPSKPQSKAVSTRQQHKMLINTAKPAKAADDVRQIILEMETEAFRTDSVGSTSLLALNEKLSATLASVRESREGIESMESSMAAATATATSTATSTLMTTTRPGAVARLSGSDADWVNIKVPKLWKTVDGNWSGFALTWFGYLVLLVGIYCHVEDLVWTRFGRVDSLGYWEPIDPSRPDWGGAIPWAIRRGWRSTWGALM